MITLSKIAKLANVSVSTASKAFSGSNEVNQETKEIIFNVAKKYGCFKKFYNVKYPKLVIAIIAPEFNSRHYTRYLSLLQSNLDKYNCELCVSTTNFSSEAEKALLEYYYKHSDVDGIIMLNSKTVITDIYEVPVIYVNATGNDGFETSIKSVLKPALFKSIDYLTENKVTEIGFIGEKLTLGKLALFKEILSEKGLTLNENYISISNERFESGGYTAMQSLFAKNSLPRAIICGYDYMAIGAIRCIYDHGLSVPEDIAVLGFDDIEQAEFLNPPLASIATPTEKICKAAAEAIIKKINGENNEHCLYFEAEFKLRKSFEIV